IALLTGTAVVGSELFLAGCKNEDKVVTAGFSENDISFFDEIAETILPRTNTPGAKDAETGKFMASYSLDCYDEKQLKALKDGITAINEAAKQKYGSDFLQINPSQRQELLKGIDAEAKAYSSKPAKDLPSHYFTLMK